MIKISLIGAFRDQHELFHKMMHSLIKTADKPSLIEVIFAIDDNDSETLSVYKEYEERYKIVNLKFLITQQSEWFIRDYYNACERIASGRFLINISADSLFVTQNWDKIIYNRMHRASKKFGDDILYGMIEDGLPNSKDEGFSCWPVSSREYVNMFGGMLPKEIPMWGADVEFGNIFSLIDKGKRKVDLRHIEIKHINEHCDSAIEKNKNAYKFELLCQKYPAFLTPEQRLIYAEKVNEYISKRI